MFNRSYTNQSAVYTDPEIGEHVMGISGSVSASIATGLVMPAYDYVSIDYSDSTTEVYTFKSGGASGTTVAIVTLVYVDATKALLSTVAKS